jgi:N4-(beta-N-acetylglucosaminyl)-L-asparaginase
MTMQHPGDERAGRDARVDAPGAWSRRRWLATATSALSVGAASSALAPLAAARAQGKVGGGKGVGPVVIASDNGFHPTKNGVARASAVPTALERLLDPATAGRRYGLLEAIVAGVGVTESDAEDEGVGIGGLPNEDGVVQLDASCMFGPTHQAGSVAAIENIKHPALAAMHVLRDTDHCMLVGDGAYRFARAIGLPHSELLTERARKAWLDWKQRRDPNDDWLSPPDEEVDPAIRALFTDGTIHCSAIDAKGDVAAVTTTSGLAWKIPGRIGDSPIIGAGMYCDNDVGAAGGTGRGEEMIVNLGAFSIVERMRGGMEPVDACLELLRVVMKNAARRGLVKDGKPTFGLTVYALRKDGAYGSASTAQGVTFAVADAEQGARLERCAYLFDA